MSNEEIVGLEPKKSWTKCVGLLNWAKSNKILVMALLVGLIGGNADRITSIASVLYQKIPESSYTSLEKRVENLENTLNKVIDVINASEVDSGNTQPADNTNSSINKSVDELVSQLSGKSDKDYSSTYNNEDFPKLDIVPVSPISDNGLKVPESPNKIKIITE